MPSGGLTGVFAKSRVPACSRLPVQKAPDVVPSFRREQARCLLPMPSGPGVIFTATGAGDLKNHHLRLVWTDPGNSKASITKKDRK